MKKRAYKGYKKKIHSYLLEDARFRERLNKNKGICNLLYKQFPETLKSFENNREKLIDVLVAYASMNRWWSRLLQDEFHPELRGKDYNDKYILRQEKQQELGYEFGYYQDKKLLSKIISHDEAKEQAKDSLREDLEGEIRITPSEIAEGELEEGRKSSLPKSKR